MDSCRNGGCKTSQLESCNELRAPGGEKRADSVIRNASLGWACSLRTFYSTSADGTPTSWDADLFWTPKDEDALDKSSPGRRPECRTRLSTLEGRDGGPPLPSPPPPYASSDLVDRSKHAE